MTAQQLPWGAEEDFASISAGAAAGGEAAAHQTAAAVQAEGAAIEAAPSPAVQAATGAGQLPADLPAKSCAFHWVPGEYELLPAGGPAVQQLVHEGAVWLLEGPIAGAASPASKASSTAAAADGDVQAAGATAGTAGTAVLVCYGPGFCSLRHAGIVAGSAAALESALLHASAVADPQCCRCGGLLGVGRCPVALMPSCLWLSQPHAAMSEADVPAQPCAATCSAAVPCHVQRGRHTASSWLFCRNFGSLPCSPHHRFYIDACSFDHPQLWASTGGPRIDILPLFRPLPSC